ncbi:hypothetical protein Hdeb2414_s0012g00376951 [Helianthus debilis subsp. tardiflorus]
MSLMDKEIFEPAASFLSYYVLGCFRYRKYWYRKIGKSGTGTEYTGSVPNTPVRYRYLPVFYL